MPTATLYINSSDTRYLEKNLTKISDVSIILKDDTSIANPTIILSGSAFDSRCNYIYIDTFDRYYTITDKTYSKQKYILTLSRDSKSSFINELKNCKCIAYRSTNKLNSYLNDSKYPVLEYTKSYAHKFKDGQTFSKSLTYVLTIAGGA